MKKFFNIILILLLSISLFSCKKKEEEKLGTITVDLSGDTLEDVDPLRDSIEIDGILYKDASIPNLGVSILIPESFYLAEGNEYYPRFVSDELDFLGIEIAMTQIPNVIIEPELLTGFSENAGFLIRNDLTYDTRVGTIVNFRNEDFSTLESTIIFGDKDVYLPLNPEVTGTAFKLYEEFDSLKSNDSSGLFYKSKNLIGEYHYGVEKLSSDGGGTSGEFFVQYNFSLKGLNEYCLSVVSTLGDRELAEKIMKAISENTVYTSSQRKDFNIALENFQVNSSDSLVLPKDWRLSSMNGISVFTCNDLNSYFFGTKILIIPESQALEFNKIAEAIAEEEIKSDNCFSGYSHVQVRDGEIDMNFDLSSGYTSYSTSVFPLTGLGEEFRLNSGTYYLCVLMRNNNEAAVSLLNNLAAANR